MVANRRSSPAGEKPLGPGARLGLLTLIVLVVLTFYLFVLVTSLLFAALLLIELIAGVVLLRFGLAGIVFRAMERQIRLLGLFFSCLVLPRQVDYHIRLAEADAPELFRKVRDLCQTLRIPMPHAIRCQMRLGAWVRLKWWGRTTLGVGYDLLAALSISELEAVLAHEMAHAKLVRRGWKSWMRAGLQRLITLTRELGQMSAACQESGVSHPLVRGALWISKGLTRWCAQLVSAYSRQDEFDADRGMAELCGVPAARDALLKVHAVADRAAELPWNQRVAQLSLPGGFSQWLVDELYSPVTDPERILARHHHTDPYSTHPSLRDRLEALAALEHEPAIPSMSRDGLATAPAVTLLAEPDTVAGRLIAEILSVASKEEKADHKALRKWQRSIARQMGAGAVQVLGVFVLIAGLFGIIIGIVEGAEGAFPWFWGSLSAAGMVLGGWMMAAGGYRDRMAFPLPTLAALQDARMPPRKQANTLADRLEQEWEGEIGKKAPKKEVASILMPRAREALERCDYIPAYAAANLCHKRKIRSVDLLLTIAVTASAFGNGNRANWAIEEIQKKAGFRTFNTEWGLAWCQILTGTWDRAEALLHSLIRRRPGNPTLWYLLALSQSRRGKHQSALVSARAGWEIESQSPAHVILFLQLLLGAGLWHEVGEHLATRQELCEQHSPMMLIMVRYCLLRRADETAASWAQFYLEAAEEEDAALTLGELYESTRNLEGAASWYAKQTETDYWPEAKLALGRVAAKRGQIEQARQHLLESLDLDRTPAPGSSGPMPLFAATMQELWQLRDPIAGCQAWKITVPSSHPIGPLRGQSFLVYATTQENAEADFRQILQAISPANSTLDVAWSCSLLPQEEQPQRPVHPGVQTALGREG